MGVQAIHRVDGRSTRLSPLTLGHQSRHRHPATVQGIVGCRLDGRYSRLVTASLQRANRKAVGAVPGPAGVLLCIGPVTAQQDDLQPNDGSKEIVLRDNVARILAPSQFVSRSATLLSERRAPGHQAHQMGEIIPEGRSDHAVRHDVLYLHRRNWLAVLRKRAHNIPFGDNTKNSVVARHY